MREGVERFGWYPASGFVTPPIGSTPWGVEGYKTLAYEVAEDLGWSAPDVVVVPSGYSDGLAGIWKGFTELVTLGLVSAPPRMIAAEPFGPLANALERGLAAPEVVDAPGSTVAFSIGSRYGTWQGLAALRDSKGAGVRLTDEGIFEAQRALAREEGLFVEASSAAALAAVMQIAARKALDPAQTIVVVLTSSGLKDPGASRTWLPPMVELGSDSFRAERRPGGMGGHVGAPHVVDEDFDRVLDVLREAYGLALDG
jgi:threonine synthase